MRSSILLIIFATSVASAQPSWTPPLVASPVQLTADDERLLDEGLISNDRIAAGVTLSVILPFGAGQAAEGRWTTTGYLFAIVGRLVAVLTERVAAHHRAHGAARIARFTTTDLAE